MSEKVYNPGDKPDLVSGSAPIYKRNVITAVASTGEVSAPTIKPTNVRALLKVTFDSGSHAPTITFKALTVAAVKEVFVSADDFTEETGEGVQPLTDMSATGVLINTHGFVKADSNDTGDTVKISALTIEMSEDDLAKFPDEYTGMFLVKFIEEARAQAIELKVKKSAPDALHTALNISMADPVDLDKGTLGLSIEPLM